MTDPQNMTLLELTRDMSTKPDSVAHLTAKAEMMRRQTQAQLEARAAEIKAAIAVRKTAAYALWAAIAAAVSASVSLVVTLVALWK